MKLSELPPAVVNAIRQHQAHLQSEADDLTAFLTGQAREVAIGHLMGAVKRKATTTRKQTPTRHMSAAGKRAISLRMKAYWKGRRAKLAKKQKKA